MTVALAVWNGRISPVFDVSRQLLLLEVRNGTVVRRYQEMLSADESPDRAVRLADLKVHTLICGAISRSLAAMLGAYGVRVISFVAGDVEEVVAAYLNGSLSDPALLMPGCCGSMRGPVRRRGRGGCRYRNGNA